LKTLSEEAHVPFQENLTKAEASRRIDELQATTGRGERGKVVQHSGEERPEGPLQSEPVLGSEAPGQSNDGSAGMTRRRTES
jgi:hypothetical protein